MYVVPLYWQLCASEITLASTGLVSLSCSFIMFLLGYTWFHGVVAGQA